MEINGNTTSRTASSESMYNLIGNDNISTFNPLYCSLAFKFCMAIKEYKSHFILLKPMIHESFPKQSFTLNKTGFSH